MHLRRQLIFAFVGFAFVLLAGTLIPFGLIARQGHRDTYIQTRLRETHSVVESLRGRPRAVQARIVANRYPTTGFTAGWLLTAAGASVRPPNNPAAFPSDKSTPEVRAALSGPDAHRLGQSPAAEQRLFIAVPIIDGTELTGVLWISSSLRPVRELDRRAWVALGGLGAAAMAAAALLGLGLSRRLTKRLEVVSSAARRFGEGGLRDPIPVGGNDEITELARALNRMAREIDGLVRREKDFVSAASHQIRTPLTAIRIRIDELTSLLPDGDPEVIEYLDEMAAEVDRLTVLTGRLLDLSAAEATPNPSPIAARPAVEEAVRRIAPLASHRSIGLDVSTIADVVVEEPPGAFEEVLFNLIDNAVKYSEAGGQVWVSGIVEDGYLLLEVADEGSGIPATEENRIFEPFYQARRTRRGHGLGLAISARLCQMAGASISLTPRRHKGTVARVRWPIPARGKHPAKPPAARHARLVAAGATAGVPPAPEERPAQK